MQRELILAGALALAPLAAAAQGPAVDPAGFLYGTVTTRSGAEHTGQLRWGREEAFWDDHFNAGKRELPYAEAGGERERGGLVRIFGLTVRYPGDGRSRQFVARFGDIREIEIGNRRHARVTMKSGSVYEVDDSSNDIGATITVEDAERGTVRLAWSRIESIAFRPAPADLELTAWRLFGRLETTSLTLEGFVQWDLEECLSTDELDGETEDGKLAIEMGRIAAIEKNDRHGAWIELRDGRRLLLEDTNDVDHSTSGIFVEDARYGRVKVGWGEFVRVDFVRTGRSGRGYDDYPALGAVSGTVTDVDGAAFRGRLVLDLDESEGWEIVDGESDGLEFHIPLVRLRALAPAGRRARLTLDDGTELELEDSADVSSASAGFLVLGAGGEETYLAWEDVAGVVLDG